MKEQHQGSVKKQRNISSTSKGMKAGTTEGESKLSAKRIGQIAAITEQGLLCNIMFKRLGADIKNATDGYDRSGELAGRYRLCEDIRRLRRELNRLSKAIEGKDM